MEYIRVGDQYYTQEDLMFMIEHYEQTKKLYPSHVKKLPLELQETILKELPNYRGINKTYYNDKQTFINRYCQLPLSLDDVLRMDLNEFNIYGYSPDTFGYYNILALASGNYYITGLVITMKQFTFDVQLFEHKENLDNMTKRLHGLTYDIIDFDIQTIIEYLNRHNCGDLIDMKNILISEVIKHDLDIDPYIITDYFDKIKTHIYSYTQHMGVFIEDIQIFYDKIQFLKFNKEGLIMNKDESYKFPSYISIVMARVDRL